MWGGWLRLECRMKRHLLNLLTAMSLLVCVAAMLLWPWSYWSYAPRDTYHRSVVHDRQAGTAIRRSARDRYVTVASGGVQFHSLFYDSMQPVGQVGTRVRSGWEVGGGRYPLAPSPSGSPGTKIAFTGGGFQLIITDFKGVGLRGGPERSGERS